MDTSTIDRLQSEESARLLDEIDQLRSEGIGEHVPLPQLVVCGDQSSGKSSVLEAISGIAFPRKDSLCTRFATEVILRKAPTIQAQVRIIPNRRRPDDEKTRLLSFRENPTELKDVSALIERAKKEMSAFGSATFFDDVLQIEVSGPERPHLTMVDLPGLIHASHKNQGEDDEVLVGALVDKYIRNPRSIILAIVSAQSDIGLQGVIRKIRKVDPQGDRTLGIITKPDTLPSGSDTEKDFLALARNEDIHYRLGWHVLRNRDYESRDASAEERDRAEADFFSKSNWQGLPATCVGVAALRDRLTKVLVNQIKRVLPGLIKDIQTGLKQCRSVLDKLGEQRKSLDEQRHFLLRLSGSFNSICKEALDGVYEEEFFESPLTADGYTKRLRAVVQNLNIDFADLLRTRGHTKHIQDDAPPPVAGGEAEYEDDEAFPLVISRKDAIQWVGRYLKRGRGRELPGTFNPLLIGQVFHEQSTRWETYARQHVQAIWRASKRFLESALLSLMDKDTFDALLFRHIGPLMAERLSSAERALDLLMKDHNRHPITYNHYFTDTLQKIKQRRLSDSIEKALQAYNKGNDINVLPYAKGVNLVDLLSKINASTEVDMDTSACVDLLDYVRAYYKVAMKTFVDNVAIQVVEREIVGNLREVFSPLQVMDMPETLIKMIATESDDNQTIRSQNSRKLAVLEKGMAFCEHHADSQSLHPLPTEIASENPSVVEGSVSSQDKGENEDGVESEGEYIRPNQVMRRRSTSPESPVSY